MSSQINNTARYKKIPEDDLQDSIITEEKRKSRSDDVDDVDNKSKRVSKEILTEKRKTPVKDYIKLRLSGSKNDQLIYNINNAKDLDTARQSLIKNVLHNPSVVISNIVDIVNEYADCLSKIEDTSLFEGAFQASPSKPLLFQDIKNVLINNRKKIEELEENKNNNFHHRISALITQLCSIIIDAKIDSNDLTLLIIALKKLCMETIYLNTERKNILDLGGFVKCAPSIAYIITGSSPLDVEISDRNVRDKHLDDLVNKFEQVFTDKN